MKYKIAIIQSRLHNYRIPFYEKLRTTLAEENIHLTLIHGNASRHEQGRSDNGYLDWAIQIKNSSVYIGANELLWQPCLKYIKDHDLVIVQQENRMLVNYWLLFKKVFSKHKVAFWGHGINCQSPKPNGLKEKWKKFFLRFPDWWFAYTDFTKNILLANAVPEQRITVVNNAIDTSLLSNDISTIHQEEINFLRKHTGLCGTNIGIYCGAIYEHKKIEFLLEAAKQIKAVIPDFELVILGAGPNAYKAKIAIQENKWIHYVGPQTGRKKALFLKLGCVFLMPGAVGLAILDSFAAGLPLITTDCKLHGPEIAYLRHGINGFISKNDIHDYVTFVVYALKNKDLLVNLSKYCQIDAKNYTVEDMACRFTDGVIKALNETTENYVSVAVS